MQSKENSRISNHDRMKVLVIAVIAGFVASLVIVGLIMAAESIVSYPRGTFYAIIGNVFGAASDDAVVLGLSLHLLAGTVIGLVAAVPIAAPRRLYTFMEDPVRRLLYGAVFGFIVWILFFVPISYTQVSSVVENVGDGFLDVSGKMIRVEDISDKFSNIVYSALGFHIQYGLIYAVITGAVIRRRLVSLREQELI